MKSAKNLAIVVALIAAVGVVMASKQRQAKTATAPVESDAPVAVVARSTAALPRLVDLGADKCIPCKMMAPILEELKTSQVGRLNVEFIDVWKNPDAGERFGARIIPTQIFFAADGTELFRHEGFFSKEDIVAKWKEFGVELAAGTPQ